jgi:hypothetical protein
MRLGGSEEQYEGIRSCGSRLSQEVQVRVPARAGIHHGGKVSRKIIRGPAGNQRKSKWQFRRHLRLPNRFPRGPLLPINRHIFFPGVAYKNDFPSFSTFNLNVTA